ncbi:MAG TPA: SWIB/MDM2 domain-containing protein [Puia sp.]|jgi:chromatin remodeling complex protein RSC6|uniref:SWIB/MDM2 domain-containing protein n=1 Tax=Puia sp. TaxID=2045100 RepID=UPI002C763689|nr:SWIB/MDM2 domain-containing protein [Puia sp.]HVU99348.1 SWIB/MDM2 domain-containing protein [Puia sp.]
MAKAVKKAAKKAAKKTAKKAPAKAKKAAPKKAAKKSARKPNAAFMTPLSPSATLAEVIGNAPRPRTEIVKKIWDYIKKNNLQDKKNKRMINADAKLKAVFGGKDQVSMFDLAKIVSKNVK